MRNAINSKRCPCGGYLTKKETLRGEEKYQDYKYEESCDSCKRLILGTLNKLDYNKSKYSMTAQTYLDNKDKLEYIESKIKKGLMDYPNFWNLDFCDFGISGIKIRCFHRGMRHHDFGKHITINYDFSNVEECISNVIEMWKHNDTDENLKSYKNFVSDGWGWD